MDQRNHAVTAGEASRVDRIRLAAWVGLGVLTFVNLFNYVDRFVVSALVESLKRSELRLSDSQLGWVATGFIIVYMLASPLFGRLGDRASRTRLIAFGVFLWSLATAAAGLARSYGSLLAARAAVGIGEAAYGTIAPALIADYFPAALRGRVFAVFFAAIPVGSALGYVLGGLVDVQYGWRAAFFVAGAPGIALSLGTLALWDAPRGAYDAPASHPTPQGLETYRALFRNRPYVLAVLGYGLYTFALGGLAFWMPAFLERVRGMSKAQATVQFGAIVVVTGFVGTFVGGWLGDLLLKRTRQAYLWVSGCATLAAVPPAIVAITATSRPVYLAAMVLAELLLFVVTGPVNSAIVNAVGFEQRATAVATSILFLHLLGDVPSPPLIGLLSDVTSLDRALLLVPVATAVGGAVWTYAAARGDGERRGG